MAETGGGDPIAAIIRQAMARQDAPSQFAAPTHGMRSSPAASSLEQTFAQLASELLRAAHIENPALLRQPTEHIEEMLRAMLTQAAYETGNFESALSKEAMNYWGMKDRDDIPAGRIFYKGEYYERFATMLDGCRGYIIALRRPRYSAVAAHCADKADFLRYVSESGWCPKKTYVNEALACYRANQAAIDRAAALACAGLASAPAPEAPFYSRNR